MGCRAGPLREALMMVLLFVGGVVALNVGTTWLAILIANRL